MYRLVVTVARESTVTIDIGTYKVVSTRNDGERDLVAAVGVIVPLKCPFTVPAIGWCTIADKVMYAHVRKESAHSGAKQRTLVCSVRLHERAKHKRHIRRVLLEDAGLLGRSHRVDRRCAGA